LKVIETLVNGLDSIRKPRKAFRGCCQCRRITVEAKNAEVLVRLEQHLRMPASTKGGIEQHARRNRSEQRHDFVRHYGQVMETGRISLPRIFVCRIVIR
jgi:hypothetical protein